MRHIKLLAVMLLASHATAQNCSPTNRCANGCCGKFGWCGFGPEYCGKDTCVADCDRKSECNPGYGAQWSQVDKCRLNVCCSKGGYCGTTSEFCGDKKVKRPSCSKTNGITRVVGYYEGWSTTQRPCNKFYPEQIPVGIYTHINFAFATIDPKTFQVQPDAAADISNYRRLALLKKKDPDLKIFIAIGGWTFNDPGPTRMVFSDLAASVPRQDAFIKSLISFMSTYDFDGVDLDWEYPEAEDRSGRPVDFANFPKFLHRLKTALDGTGGKNGLSITLPASLWYLKHFDLQALAKEVSWFNIMSYDMHGTWDKGNKWTGNFLNAHTNLTEITDALDLLWRNDVDPSMVVLGLAFYGRAFTASSSGCLEPGCTFESGADRGKCSKEVGILLNSEIDELVVEHNVKPKWYRSAAVKVAAWGNQWVGYDDEDTLRQKSEFAQSQCLGGLMVWAISHDTKDAKYSKILAKVANRRFSSLAMTIGDDQPYSFVLTNKPQCRWTNCGEGCPAGWVLMKRSDPGARGDEYMFDDTGCDGGRSHTFCCPPNGGLPTCGWYTHNNGRCDGTCPEGTVEVGSNDQHCHGGYQAACCSMANSASTGAYTYCDWGPFPNCFDCDDHAECREKCPSTSDPSKVPFTQFMLMSAQGSGGATCDLDLDIRQKRRLCCIPVNNKKRNMAGLTSCKRYNSLGLAGSDKTKDNFCWSGCPPDTLRIAMDGLSDNCAGKQGSEAWCCTAYWMVDVMTENPVLAQYKDSLKAYLQHPTCPDPGLIHNARLLPDDPEDEDGMVRRANQTATADQGALLTASDADVVKVESLLLTLLTAAASKPMVQAEEAIWDELVGPRFEFLRIANLRSFLATLDAWHILGPIEMVHRILCSPTQWNQRAGRGRGGGSTTHLICPYFYCAPSDGGPFDEREPCDGRPTPRGGRAQRRSVSVSSAREDGLALVSPRAQAARNPYQVVVTGEDGQSFSFMLQLPEYPTAGSFDSANVIYDQAVDFADLDDCGNTAIAPAVLENGRWYETEHPLDGQLIGIFMNQAASGRLPSGATFRTGRISASFFRRARELPLPLNTPPPPGGAPIAFNRPYERIMECLGSHFNQANFMLVLQIINQFKGSLVAGGNPVADDTWDRLVAASLGGPPPGAENPIEHITRPLTALRAAVAVVHYMNSDGTPPANQRLANVIHDINNEWIIIENAWNAANPNERVRVSEAWRQWARDEMAFVAAHTRRFVQRRVDSMRREWGTRTGEMSIMVLEALAAIEGDLPYLIINTSRFP